MCSPVDQQTVRGRRRFGFPSAVRNQSPAGGSALRSVIAARRGCASTSDAGVDSRGEAVSGSDLVFDALRGRGSCGGGRVAESGATGS